MHSNSFSLPTCCQDCVLTANAVHVLGMEVALVQSLVWCTDLVPAAAYKQVITCLICYRGPATGQSAALQHPNPDSNQGAA